MGDGKSSLEATFVVREPTKRVFRVKVKPTVAARAVCERLGYDDQWRCRCSNGCVLDPDKPLPSSEKEIEVVRRRWIVLTTTCSRYLPIFEVWLSHVSIDVGVVCLDSKAADRVKQLGCRVLYHPATTRREIWIARLEAVLGVTGEFTDIIHSDADAFWLQNPLPSIDSAMLAFSIDHGLGKGQKSFALCCGFYKVVPTSQILEFLHTWLQRTRDLGDDQVAVNQLYDDLPPAMTLLPYEDFQRCNAQFPVHTRPIVWHPWLPASTTIDEKLHVWTTVLDDLDQSILHRFYERSESTILDARELAAILCASSS